MVVEAAELPSTSRAPTTTLQGWRSFVTSVAPTIEMPDATTLAAMSDSERERYDEQRISYHSELVIVETSTVRSITNQGRLLMMLNQREISARRGLVVSGPWASGKTTAIKLLGKTHELLIRRKYPRQDRIPVVYITTPPKGSPRKLASEFANFLGLPQRPRQNVTDIADAVCQVLSNAKTDLVIVDEIHNLNLATSAGEDMSDHLKYFTEHMPATFVYAGINVENSGLFTGLRGRQISARSVLKPTGPFPHTEEWDALVATLENGLRLEHHEPGTLTDQAPYLHYRTGGSISSLSHLIRQAAIMAILTGTEKIDRVLRNEMDQHRPRRGIPRTTTTSHHRIRIRTMRTVAAVRTPPRPLPRPIRPYNDETTPSFIRRLETANTLRRGQLRTLLKGSRRPWVESLAAWTDYDPAVLVLAMPQLGMHDPDPSLRQRLAGRPTRTTHTVACHRCTLARGAGRYVEIYSTHEQVICPRHGLWIGDAVNGFTDQFSIGAGPEITAAWHHHKNLINRHGRSGVRKAFHIASVINWRWYDQFQHFTAATDTYDSLAADQPPQATSHATVAASLYPSIVNLTAAMGSPHWAQIAHSRRPDAFLDRVSEEVTEGWIPKGSFDPLRQWMTEDWLPGFRGSDTILPPKPQRLTPITK